MDTNDSADQFADFDFMEFGEMDTGITTHLRSRGKDHFLTIDPCLWWSPVIACHLVFCDRV
jgi:hypothetical protein